MLCPKCGKAIKDDSRFCGLCGENIAAFFERNADIIGDDILSLIKRDNFDLAENVILEAEKRGISCVKFYLAKLLIEYRIRNISEISHLKEDITSNPNYTYYVSDVDDASKEEIITLANAAKQNQYIEIQDGKYKQACSMLKEHKYDEAKAVLKELGDWKDAPAILAKCDELQHNHLLEVEREKKIKAEKEAKLKKRNRILVSVFVPLTVLTIVFLVLLNAYIIPESKYNKALEMYKRGNIKEAAYAMENLDEYKGSKQLAAEYYFEIEDYENASRLFSSLGSEEKANKCYYLMAKQLFAIGNYDEALSDFHRLPNDYEDVDKYLFLCKLMPIKNTAVGDVVEFGTYEQDNDKSTTDEKIEWVVVENNGSKVKLFSVESIDCKLFYEGDGETFTPWSKLYIRDWLNNEFFNKAFSEKEKNTIATTKVVTKDEGGTDISYDKVFLISDDEYYDYTYYQNPIPYVRNNSATKYAIAQDDKNDDITNGWAGWFTRSQRGWSGAWGGFMYYTPGNVGKDGLYHVFSGAHTGGIKPCIVIDFGLIE